MREELNEWHFNIIHSLAYFCVWIICIFFLLFSILPCTSWHKRLFFDLLILHVETTGRKRATIAIALDTFFSNVAYTQAAAAQHSSNMYIHLYAPIELIIYGFIIVICWERIHFDIDDVCALDGKKCKANMHTIIMIVSIQMKSLQGTIGIGWWNVKHDRHTLKIYLEASDSFHFNVRAQ